MAKIYDVAKKAGVGVSTVSKVLNDYDNISEVTRDRVLKAVEELNYVPNPIAAALSSKKSNRIALVVYTENISVIDEISLTYLNGATHAARDLGLEPITMLSPFLKGKTAAQLKSHFKSMRINSIVIFGMRFYNHEFDDLIDEQAFPTVLVDVEALNEHISCVMVDHSAAQYELIEKMIQLHKPRNILYISGIEGAYVSDCRLAGALKSAEDHGIEMSVFNGQFSQRLAGEIAQAHANDFDMIVTASDMMAIGVHMALKKMGISKPISGFDGLKLLGYISDSILSVKQDFDEIARLAVSECLRVSVPENQGRQIFVEYKIGVVEYEDILV